jgi:hypothetical protein
MEILLVRQQDLFVSKRNNKPAALDHALYEMIMLHLSLPPLFDPSLQPVMRSGWLEVFAIHARNLNEFFGTKRRWAEDMRPEDFISGWSHGYAFDSEIKDRADKQVAHLTYQRETPEEKTNWPVARILTNLRVPCLDFLRAVHTQKDLMGYNDNQVRTEMLLRELPKIVFEPRAESNANVAAVHVSVSRTLILSARPLDTTDV